MSTQFLGTANFATKKPNAKASQFSAVTTCKATSENSGKTASSESILLDEQSLERELQVAIMLENYAEAARIRDDLRTLHEDRKTSVLAANSPFYDAFSKGDLASMQALWFKGEDVCCVHPGASGISGYDLVMTSWEYVWVNYEFPLQIELKDANVHVRGDVGYVTCVELVRTKGAGEDTSPQMCSKGLTDSGISAFTNPVDL